jgi:hypothetical protein
VRRNFEGFPLGPAMEMKQSIYIMKMVEKACAIFNKQPLLKGKFYKLTELNALEEKEKKDKKIKEIFTYFAEGPEAKLNVA